MQRSLDDHPFTEYALIHKWLLDFMITDEESNNSGGLYKTNKTEVQCPLYEV